MVATDETIWETRPEHKHRHRRTPISSAAEVYPGVPWMVDPVVLPVPNENTAAWPFHFSARAGLAWEIGKQVLAISGAPFTGGESLWLEVVP